MIRCRAREAKAPVPVDAASESYSSLALASKLEERPEITEHPPPRPSSVFSGGMLSRRVPSRGE
jgi:hypothetical protein